MIEKLDTKAGYVLVSENYIDVTNEERPELLQGDEGGGFVWVVIQCGMGVHRFQFDSPEEADMASALITFGAAKARALQAGESTYHGTAIGPAAVTQEHATADIEAHAAAHLRSAAEFCAKANGGEAAREHIAKALDLLGKGGN